MGGTLHNRNLLKLKLFRSVFVSLDIMQHTEYYFGLCKVGICFLSDQMSVWYSREGILDETQPFNPCLKFYVAFCFREQVFVRSI